MSVYAPLMEELLMTIFNNVLRYCWTKKCTGHVPYKGGVGINLFYCLGKDHSFLV